MNQPLRRLHWRVFRVLRFLVPALFLIGMLGYQRGVRSEIPESLRGDLPETAVLSSEQEDVYEGHLIRVEIFAVPPQGFVGARRWVRITTKDPLRQPDIILYWATRESTFERPPLGAQMLGVLDERRPTAWQLPSQATVLGGRLVLFSEGQKVLVAQIPLPSPI